MLPRFLLLFAFVLISFKVFHVIHTEIFKRELCDDDFYTGGIKDIVSNANLKKKHNVTRNVHKSRRPSTSRPAASYKPAMTQSRGVTYTSYESYKKINSSSK
ncbi:MAG: hypothetical protein WBH44_02790 [Proteocatella sp.]